MRTFSCLPFIFATALLAQQEEAPEQTPPTIMQGEPLQNGALSGYSMPSRIQTREDWNVTVEGAFNYLIASQDEMDFAVTQTTTSPFYPSNRDTQGPLLFQDFEYKPGFSLSAFANTPYDDWLAGVDYLWYRGTTHNSAVGEGPVFYRSRWLGNGFDAEFGSVNFQWTLGIDQADAVISRPFYSGKRLLIVPSAGLRGLWIRQEIQVRGDVRGSAVAFSQRNGSSDSWAVGPVAGLSGRWVLYSDLALIAKGHASLAYTRYTTLSLHAFNNSNQTGNISMNGYSTVRPAIDLSLGLSWGTFLQQDSYYLNFQALYGFMAYFSQNMLYSILSPQFSPTANPGSLYLNGLTLSAAFLF